jgi:HEPN domain-containing protein
MFNTGRWTYVACMCQQAIEKLVKGLYILYKDDNIPFLHDPGKIFTKYMSEIQVTIPEDMFDFFAEITSYYLKCAIQLIKKN